MINLKIDPEFQSQIPPLTDDEFKQLEENILKEGKLLSPLIVWNNTLVDGHNRYAILQKHPEICFSTMPLRFANREEALAWICKNQLGRRNLSPEQKRYLLGKQYESEKKAEKIFHGNQYTLAKKSGGSHDDTHHSGKKTCDRIAEENGVSRASVLRARHYTKGVDIADTLSPGIKKKVFSGEVKFTNDEMTKLVQSSPDKRQDVFAEIMHPEITKAMEAADAEPNADTPVPMPTADPEQFKTYQVPDEFMRVYKTLSTATEMMKNTWKRVLKNNQSYLSDPEKQKVLRFAMQRPALYLNELEACMEQILAETLEEAEKTALNMQKQEKARQDSIAAEQKKTADAEKKRNTWMIIGGIILALGCFAGNQVLQHFRSIKNQKNMMEMQQNIVKQAENEAKRQARNYSRQKTGELVSKAKQNKNDYLQNKMGKQINKGNKSRNFSI